MVVCNKTNLDQNPITIYDNLLRLHLHNHTQLHLTYKQLYITQNNGPIAYPQII
jgi:hypothetical protein